MSDEQRVCPRDPAHGAMHRSKMGVLDKHGEPRYRWRCHQCKREGKSAGLSMRTPKPKAKGGTPCACGCGEICSPGAKFRQGHHLRKPRRRGAGLDAGFVGYGTRDRLREQQLAEPLRVIVPCGKEFDGPAAEAIAAGNEHQAECEKCWAVTSALASGMKIDRLRKRGLR